ncbi:QRFP-like peptide receptor [Ptychodera flava]|uniref:QRFP-like peptide receptor n=1 Tax=Ptychodera flava TaxID=63121 RepID=UPI00396AA6CB
MAYTGENITYSYGNSTDHEYQLSQVTLAVTTSFYVLIFLLGIVGNILVLFVVCCNKDMRSSTNYFLVNLSVADLLVLLVCMPVALLETYVIKPWLLGEAMCKLVPFLEYSTAQASVLTLVFISMERYVAICHPLKAQYTITPGRSIKICVLIWLIACGASIPYLFMAKHSPYDMDINGELLYECGTFINSTLAEVYIVSCFFLFFALPLVLLGGLYLKVALALNRSQVRVQANGMSNGRASRKVARSRDESIPMQTYCLVRQDTGSSNSSVVRTPSSSPVRIKCERKANSLQAQQRTRKRVVYMLLAVVITFFICLLPQRIVSLWFKYGTAEQQMSLGVEGVYTLVIVCRVLTYLNSSINPLIYNIMSSKFRSAFVRALGFESKLRRIGTMSSRNGSVRATTATAV